MSQNQRKAKKIFLYDSTLRDGAQGEGISFTVEDKLAILKELDNFGVNYIEAGNPGSNPKDLEFFKRASELKLKNSRLVAFGSTRRKNTTCSDDASTKSLLEANTPAVAIFGKCWDLHVTDILGVTLSENLEMIEDTVRYFHSNGKEVIFDGEHFFDGYKANPDYAIAALGAAAKNGATSLALCDTNGGCFPEEIAQITKTICNKFKNVTIGIHCHNDSGLAIANSLVAINSGATQVQGTFIGFGERTGNANLAVIIPNLQLKKNYSCVPDLSQLTQISNKIAEITNIALDNSMPFVGKYAFAHKAGMHIDGVLKIPKSFEHVSPDSVGNERRFALSEISGRKIITEKVNRYNLGLNKNSTEISKILARIKALEHYGYMFESADASFFLVVLKTLELYEPLFGLIGFKVINEMPAIEGTTATAVIKIRVKNETRLASAEGEGPINALDIALRKALCTFYPILSGVSLIDYKVRVLDCNNATASKVRVLITSTDGTNKWTTVGVSRDIVQASYLALVESMEYKLIVDKMKTS